jgi:alpha-beta hydrolase superfamily lysophospholipase
MCLRPVAVACSLALSGLVGSDLTLLSQQPAGRGSYIATRGRDTTSIERFSTASDRLEGEIIAPRTPWQSYRLEGALGGPPRSFDLTIRPPFSPRDTAPSEVRRLLFAGDSVNESRTLDGKTSQRQRFAGASAVPILYPSLALLEVAMRHARLMGDSPGQISFVEVGYRERQFFASLSWIGADSARLDLGGTEFRLAVDAAGRVLGGRVPSMGITIERQDHWVELSAPDYTAPAGAPYTAEPVRIATAGNHWLSATLTLPKTVSGRVPVAITIPGTGQLDRDGSPDGFGGYQLNREIAEVLAVRGVALLRYDKRGVGGSSQGQGSTSEALADDVRAVLRFLRARNDIAGDRIILIGHSEGAIIAPMVAASDSEDIRAVVLLAAPARLGRDVIRSQLRAQLAANPALSDAQRDSLATQRLARTDAAAAAGSWMRFYLDYDPLPVARRVRAPVLILQGQTDQQVAPEQAELLASAMRQAGNARVTVQMLPNVNHMLLDDPVGRSSGYSNLPSRRINTQALRLLSDWVAEQLRK